MRHRRRGRTLGRSPSHRKALLKNLASALFLTERDATHDDNAPKVTGRITTTLHKAKEVRPLVEKCITIAKKSISAADEAKKFESSAERGSDAWKQWRKSDDWQKWANARAPVVAARRRVVQLIGDKQAAKILFDTIAERFVDRPGGYTRILRLATPRLGDNGERAILEFVGKNDRVKRKAERPAFDDDLSSDSVASDSPKDDLASDDLASNEASAALTKLSSTSPDDLKVVEGIGPKVEQALKDSGITSWEELAAAEADKIKEILTAAEGNFSGQDPTTWPEQAKLAAAGDWEKLNKWQDELDGGKAV